jgi:hypothetical protein
VGTHKRNNGGWRRDGWATQAPVRCQSVIGEKGSEGGGEWARLALEEKRGGNCARNGSWAQGRIWPG